MFRAPRLQKLASCHVRGGKSGNVISLNVCVCVCVRVCVRGILYSPFLSHRQPIIKTQRPPRPPSLYLPHSFPTSLSLLVSFSISLLSFSLALFLSVSLPPPPAPSPLSHNIKTCTSLINLSWGKNSRGRDGKEEEERRVNEVEGEEVGEGRGVKS